MRPAAVVIAALCAACDSNVNQQPGGGSDAPVDITASGGDGMACLPVPSGPFSAPTLSSALSSPQFDGKPSLTADQLEVFFKSGRPDDMTVRIWHSTRALVGATWSAPTEVTALTSNQYDTSPTISADGLTIWFVSYRTGGPGGGDFYTSTRTNRSAPWSAPRLVTELNTPMYEDGLTVDPTGHVAYFHSNRDTGSNSQIYRTTRSSPTGTWTTPVLVAELSGSSDDTNAWVSPDDCTLYFDTTRPGGLGQYDVFAATRPAPGARFARVQAVPELNSTLYDADPFLSADQRSIYFTSNRPSSEFNIYEASR